MKASWGLHTIAALLLTSYVFAKRRPWENEGMFEGDIDGIDPYILYDRNAVVNEARLWPGGIIYYEIDGPLMKAEGVINEAIADFEAKTCLRFRKRTASTQDYCRLMMDNGMCYSRVGRTGGMQNISLGEGCHTKATVVHEIMHAAGFWHEHARSDRDDYLRIMWKNIEEGMEHNFIKQPTFGNNLLGEEFDFDSVMLYDSYAFSKDGRSMTMIPWGPRGSILRHPDNLGLSDLDVVKINKLYECFGNKRPPPLEVPDFECNFDDGDTCGMYNSPNNEGANWAGYRGTLGGRKSTYLALYERDSSTNVARLYTPHLKGYGRENGCFQFDAYFNGAGAANLDVQALVSGRVMNVLRVNKKQDAWVKINLNLAIKENDIQFRFDGQISKADGRGIMAIDNIRYSLKKCEGFGKRNSQWSVMDLYEERVKK